MITIYASVITITISDTTTGIIIIIAVIKVSSIIISTLWLGSLPHTSPFLQMTTGEPLSNFLYKAVLASETRHMNVCEVNGRKFILTAALEEETVGTTGSEIAGGIEDAAGKYTQSVPIMLYIYLCMHMCLQNTSTVY